MARDVLSLNGSLVECPQLSTTQTSLFKMTLNGSSVQLSRIEEGYSRGQEDHSHGQQEAVAIGGQARPRSPRQGERVRQAQ